MNSIWTELESEVADLQEAPRQDPRWTPWTNGLSVLLGEHLLVKGMQQADADVLANEMTRWLIGHLAEFEDRGSGSFKAWCAKSLNSAAFNFFRSQARRIEVSMSPESLDQRAVPVPVLFDESDEIDAHGELNAAFARLKEVDREILRLRCVAEWEHPAIADELNEKLGLKLTADCVRTRFLRAKRRIAKSLGRPEASRDDADG